MNSLMRSLLIALIPACPLIFSSCETSPPPLSDEKPAVSNTNNHDHNHGDAHTSAKEKPAVSNTNNHDHNHGDTHTSAKNPLSDEKPAANLITSFRVDGLTCSNCNNILKSQLENHPGIISAEVNYKIDPPKPNTIVEHEAHISREDIIKIITDTDYTVEN